MVNQMPRTCWKFLFRQWFRSSILEMVKATSITTFVVIQLVNASGKHTVSFLSRHTTIADTKQLSVASNMALKPEQQGTASVFYGSNEALRYNTCSQTLQLQRELTQAAIQLLNPTVSLSIVGLSSNQ